MAKVNQNIAYIGINLYPLILAARIRARSVIENVSANRHDFMSDVFIYASPVPILCFSMLPSVAILVSA